MKVTYYGHLCFGLEANGKNLLFDPFVTGNELAKDKVDVDAIPADVILLSHGHFDHVTDAARIAKRTGAKVYANFEVANWVGEQGVENVQPMNQGGQIMTDFGKIKYVSAIHSSSLPNGSYGGNPGGYIVHTDTQSMYFSGDTALNYDMKMLGEMENIDFSILPIGDVLTMGAGDAAIACQWVNCDKAIGGHYDTFPFIKIDPQEAKSSFMAKGKELILMEIGASIQL